ncbi:MAG: pectinesterase family protein [Phycisphaerales bacterium]|jgi:pectin methylesterase-like acyl-CoA thioesterase/acetyl esterase/lipase
MKQVISLFALVVFLLFLPVISAANIQTDIEYGKAGGESLLLDVSTPEGDGPFPVVIFVHGGGWSRGDKQDNKALCESLTAANFTYFSINYRLAPKHRWPACFEDAKTAIRWAKANASKYKGDSNRIALIGYSAGGQLATLAAVRADEDTRVQAVVGLAAPTDLVMDTLRRWELSESLENLFGRDRLDEKTRQTLWDASPINHLKPNLPPFLLIHSTDDSSVPYQLSLNFQKRLSDLNVQCDLVTIKGAPHRISEWDKFDSNYKNKMVDWLELTLKSNKQSGIDKPTVIIVSADGTGDFTTVQAAVDSVPTGSIKPVVISIKPGIYKEQIVVPRGKRFIHFAGEDAKTTILTFDLNARMISDNGKEIGTFKTPSTTIESDDFSAENITFENSAGPVGQALAMSVFGDRVAFHNCRFLGWQDTLLDQTGRHYYENCYIEGHVDFIFGGGTVFFERCHIHCLRKGYITAASTPEHQNYGYVFSNCKITGEPEVKTYLGRPWRDYANVIFLNTEMSEVVRPEGWHNWKKPHREKTSRYAEFNSTGPGENPQARVSWARQLTEAEAKAITVESVLSGKDGWNPKTGKVNSTLKVIPASPGDIESIKEKAVSENCVYLFTSFRGNGEDGLHLAYSHDSLNFKDLGGPFLKPQVGIHKLMRDPSLLQGPDGMFHLVWTTGWRDDKGFGYAKSKDLIHWSEQKFIEVMANEPDTYNVWAPELYYDKENNHFIICWASTIPSHYPEYSETRNSNNHRMYCTTTRDFETFTDTRKFFEPGYSVIDGIIVKWSDRYVLVHKDNTRPMRNLRVAFSDKAIGPYIDISGPFTEKFTEGPSALQIDDTWIIYFDMYEKDRYGAVTTEDFNTWKDITSFVSFPQDHRHGSVLKVSPDILKGLQAGVLQITQDLQ